MMSLLPLFLILVTGGPPASSPVVAASSTAPAEISPAIETLVGRLGDPRFNVREEATRQLCQADTALASALVGRYKTERSHERKLRLREVIENLFFRKQMQGEVGFLGIRLMLVENIVDPGVGRAGECVCAQEVLKGFPAEPAGRRDGDNVVSLDRKPISWFFAAAPPPASGPAQPQPIAPNPLRASVATNEKIERFTQHIKRRTPGSKVLLRVLRASSPSRTITIAAAAEPARTLDGATLVSVPGSMVGPTPMSVMNTRGGLLVRSVVPGSPAQLASLKPRDVVVAFNGVPLPAQVDPAMIAQVLKATAPGSPVTIETVELKEVELPVTIGRRPVSRLNPQDLLEAQERFAIWWREQTGEHSIPRPAQPRNLQLPTDPLRPFVPEAGVEP